MIEKNPSSVITQNCLRCLGVELILLTESTNLIAFFECPSCHRHYAQKHGRPLVYRWLHPVSLPLYAVLFDPEPLPKAQSVAKHLAKNRSKETLNMMIDEIELELHHPTQNIRDILDNYASEEKCREFLEAFVAQIRSIL